MIGDIINNAVGSFNGQSIAKNDILSRATGDLTSCTLKLPYSDSDMTIRRNNVSTTAQNKAQVLVERNRAYEDWHDCKKKLLCNAKPKENRLDEWEQKKNASEAAALAATEELARAEKANKEAQVVYYQCVEQQTKLMQLQKTAQKDLINNDASTTQQSGTGSGTVVASETTGMDNKIMYGGIAAGLIVVAFLGYLIIKKK